MKTGLSTHFVLPSAVSGTDVHDSLASVRASRLSAAPNFLRFAAQVDPGVARALELAGGRVETLGALRDQLSLLEKMGPKDFEGHQTQARVMAGIHGTIRQQKLFKKDLARQERLLEIKSQVPEWLREELILVKGGWFMMGEVAPQEKLKHSLYVNVYPVWVSAFLMSSTHVTNAMWKNLMTGQNPSASCGEGFAPDEHPVVGINQDDIANFLNAVEEQMPGLGAKIHFPTEAQWEWAARAGQGLLYATNDGTLSRRNACYGYSYRGGTTIPVKAKPPNPWGFYGLCGNAWDRCRGASKNDADKGVLQIDPDDGLSDNECRLRGGAYYILSPNLRDLLTVVGSPFGYNQSSPCASFRIVIEI